MDAGEVERAEERNERENNKAEIGIAAEESIVQPVTQRIFAGAGRRHRERSRDSGVSRLREKQRASGAIGVGEHSERRDGAAVVEGENIREKVDARTSFGYGLPP